jgi:hypothetical protein
MVLKDFMRRKSKYGGNLTVYQFYYRGKNLD